MTEQRSCEELYQLYLEALEPGYRGSFRELPQRCTTGVLIQKVVTGQQWTLCKSCYILVNELADEWSLSTATAQPQPDMVVEKHIALIDIGKNVCRQCGNRF